METPGSAVPNRRRGRCKCNTEQAGLGERKPVDGETSGGENKSCRGDKNQSSQSVPRWNILGTRPYQTIIIFFWGVFYKEFTLYIWSQLVILILGLGNYLYVSKLYTYCIHQQFVLPLLFVKEKRVKNAFTYV